MRVIPDSVQQLLASRTMLGPNAPRCIVSFSQTTQIKGRILPPATTPQWHFDLWSTTGGVDRLLYTDVNNHLDEVFWEEMLGLGNRPDVTFKVYVQETGEWLSQDNPDQCMLYQYDPYTVLVSWHGLYNWGETYFRLYHPDGLTVEGQRIRTSILAIQPDSIKVSREPGALAQRCQFSFPNVNPNDPTDLGWYSPDRGASKGFVENEWQGFLMPGRNFCVDLGYGENMVRSFTGTIDDVTISRDPDNATIAIDARCYGWRLVDKAVQGDDGRYVLRYTDIAMEDMVRDLLRRAGWADEDITTEPTGLVVQDKAFDRCTYGDALEWAMNASGFELTITEEGRATFLWPTSRQPEQLDGPITLTAETHLSLSHGSIVLGSEIVKNATDGTIYTRDTDYGLNPSTGGIWRIASGSIPDGGEVLVSYVYAAWCYREGQDLYQLPYKISRRSVYSAIRVVGAELESGTGNYYGTYQMPGYDSYGLEGKVLFVDQSELASDEDCNAVAARLGLDMERHVREVQFQCVAIPWLQVGDCVQVIESSSTISEVYRITNFDIDLSPDGFAASCSAYHYGYTPIPTR